MKLKKGMRALSLLLIMALLTAMLVPVVSAEEKNPVKVNQNNQKAIFELCDYTHEFKTQVLAESKTADALAVEYGKLNIPSTIKKYDIVQFSEVSINQNQKNSLKVKIYDKEYTMNLERMNFENIDDGIDSYSGSIDGLDNSVTIFTFGKNLVHGTIQFQDEIIFIEPVQNREYATKTAMPLHIIYSSKDMIQPSESEIAKLEKLSSERSKTTKINSPSDLYGVPVSLDSVKASKS
ncbi:hypothetical protein [Methanoplanus limicola]|uniref:hypothetical protein n=1 Tax=Methanoplanus limicola TaxID=2315 RepID=UPI00064FCEFF|nr:hypothetical protein [Methanoplanus limicola]